MLKTIKTVFTSLNDKYYYHNISKQDKKCDWPIQGRVCLNLDNECKNAVKLEWNLWSNFVHAEINFDEMEPEIRLSLAFPPVAFWFSFKSWPLFRKIQNRVIGFSFHDGALWWRFWADPNCWKSTDPIWKEGNVNIIDFLLGKSEVSSKVLDSRKVEIPMPEKLYYGICSLIEQTVSRPRGLTKYFRMAEIIPDEPIPVPGKGENSWDCEDDAIYSMTMNAKSYSKAIGKFVQSILSRREKYAGLNWRPEK